MLETMDADQARFEGWAVVDVMGHQRHIGFVTTEAYGQAVLFRVDTPGLDEREFVLTRPESASDTWCPAGSRVRRSASPAHSILIGASSIYEITPCTEEAARHAIEKNQARPLILIEMPSAPALAAANASGGSSDDDEEGYVFDVGR
jgi:hypothetical protein